MLRSSKVILRRDDQSDSKRAKDHNRGRGKRMMPCLCRALVAAVNMIFYCRKMNEKGILKEE
jgi:hypothetical protein